MTTTGQKQESVRIGIVPNVKMLQSARASGYSNYSAIADLVDNCIDAGAKNVYIDINNSTSIRIADDASGMNESTLIEGLKMGSETGKDTSSTLGRFGFGLKTASLSIGRRLTVMTKMQDAEFVTAIHDFDEMNKEREFFVRVDRGLEYKDHANQFQTYTRNSTTGTVVMIDNLDRLSNNNIPAFRGLLKTYLGEVFRNFISSKSVNIHINGVKIPAADTMLVKSKSVMYSDRTYPMPYIDTTGKQRTSLVRVVLYIMPDLSKSGNKELGINQTNQGLYVMRNNRQIIRSNMQWLGLTKGSYYNRFRGEIYLSGELDETVGIDFQKMETANIKKYFETRIQSIIKPGFDAIMTQVRNDMMNRLVEDEEREEQYRRIEDDINAHYDDVKKLKPEPEKIQTPVTDVLPTEEEEEEKEQKTPAPRKPKTKKLVETCNARLGVDGLMCDFFYKPDGVLRLTWNVDHRFYTGFLVDANTETLGVIVKLFASMARNELRVFNTDDERRAMVEEFNQLMSDEMSAFMAVPTKKRGNTVEIEDLDHPSIA